MLPSLLRLPVRLACLALALAGLGAGRLGSRTAAPLRAASAVAVQVTGTVVNLRAGPGPMHTVRGQARPTTVLTVQGRSADDAWLAVADPEGGAHTLWIAADRTDVGARRYALPWAGPPRVCTRSADVQAALRAAWAAQGLAQPCSEATWADLAALTALPPGADDRLWLWEPHDLAGLTGLRAARVVVTDAYAAAGGRLSGLAGLERLDLQGACCAARPWPSHFLAGAARLRALAVAFPPPAREPADFPPPGFLADATRLERLTLEAGYSATARPFDFLAHTPHLHTLVLNAPLRVLPAGFLANAPQLRTFNATYSAYHLTALPADFLANAPQLRTFALRDAYDLTALPAGFLANAPQLRTFALRDARNLTALPAGFLANAPQLRTLDLHGARNLTALPESFLAHAPQLRTLDLHGARNLTALPESFLAHAPQLRTLDLHGARNLTALPESFLAHAPQLRTLDLTPERALTWPAIDTGCQRVLTLRTRLRAALNFLHSHAPCLQRLELALAMDGEPSAAQLMALPQLEALTLYVDRATAWLAGPSGLLAQAPRLRTLELHAAATRWGTTPLPLDFLASAPQLQTLTLALSEDVTRVPAHTLVEAPQLTQFRLQAPDLRELPRGFLARAPRLRRLEMDTPALQGLPVGFLARAPRLERLSLNAYRLAPLPDGFLAHVPRLERLSLRARYLAPLPDGFLAHVPRLTDFTLDAPMAVLPDGFLAHVPRLERLTLDAYSLAALPNGFLAHAPRLRALDHADPLRTSAGLYLPALTAIGDRVLAHAPALGALVLDAPRLATVGEDFLARADRLQTLTLLTEAPAPLRLGARFLARAPQVHTVRIGATAAPDAQTDLAAVALAAPAAFLADLPRLRTVELRTPLRDPPPPGFLRGAALRDLRLRVRIAADAQGARRLPARVQAAHWRLELTCDSAYPAAWLAPLAAPPPAALTVAPCHDEGSRYGWHAPVPPRLPAAALRAFLAGAPAATRLQLANYAQLAPADYARLPVSALGFALDRRTFTGWVRAADAPRSFDGRSVEPDRALPVQAAPHADAPVLVSLAPGRPYDDYPILAQTDAPERWLRIPYAQASAELAPTLAVPALEALYLEFALHAPEADVAPFAAALAAPAFLLDLYRDEPLAPLLRAPPAPIRHLGVRAPLGARAQHRWDLTRRLDGDLAAALPDLDFACLQLVLPTLDTPLPAQLRAAARRHGLALRLVAGFAPDRLPALDRTDALGRDAAAYFQQQHLPWAAARACPRSLLLIDNAIPSMYPRVEYLPPDLLDRPGARALQRVRIVFDPRQCPECRADR